MGKAHPHIEDNLLYSKCTDLMLIVSENIVIETAKLVLTKQLCTMVQPSSHIKLTITDSIESSHISHSQFPLFSTSYIITLSQWYVINSIPFFFQISSIFYFNVLSVSQHPIQVITLSCPLSFLLVGFSVFDDFDCFEEFWSNIL